MQFRLNPHPRSIRKFIAAAVLALSVIAATPHGAYAKAEEDIEHYDARVQGYEPDVELKSWGTSGSWMVLILMAVCSVAVIFKDAKRTHLD